MGVQINTLLWTKNGRDFGNAICVGKKQGKYVLRCDLGNKVVMSGREIVEKFWVGNVAVKHKWMAAPPLHPLPEGEGAVLKKEPRAKSQETEDKVMEMDGWEPDYYWELQEASLTMVVNYSYHFGAKKKDVMERLGIIGKVYNDLVWLYDNKGYKAKVLEFVELEKLKFLRKRDGVKTGERLEFYDLIGCSLTFKVNYAIHFGVVKEVVMEKLEISNKRFIDLAWKYNGAGYKRVIEEWLERKMVA